ncbi:hypothetical protein L1987_81138 [Smallanthus sonchifolius]|uniref:Uncharacterized protein n=1 Tax=Smallanthus sonchifolius TaxID=185202 RepID=A0ACB8YNY8_9ASTR|nr:hypothetical protein L1987_81138 [Smallanthus sonchifolius]
MKRREGYIDKDRVYKYSEKDSKQKGEVNRKREDKYHEDGNRGYKHKEERYWDDVERDHRHKLGRPREDSDRKKRSRDHTSEFESKKLKDGSHRHTNKSGGSLIYDDRVAGHKDNKDVRRDSSNNNKDEVGDYKSRSIQDRRLESKSHMNDAKIDPNFERGTSSPRNDDMEITANHSRQRSSLNCKYYPSRDHHRVSKQEETKYTDIVHGERSHHNFISNRDLSDKVCNNDLSAKKRLKPDSQLSPSSTNKNSSNLPPQPPFKAGSDNLLGFGSSEDDRGKISDRNWKSVDHDLGRTQTNWNNFSNWPYMPFHHFPPPMFNPFMYQSVLPMLGGPPMNMNHATMPYHFTGGGFGNWDHGSTELNGQSWESNVVSDSVDLQSAVKKSEDPVHGHTDEIWSGHTGPHIEVEENNLDFNTPEVTKDFNTPEVTKVTESSNVSMVGKDDDTLISRVYLSKIDISKDLSRPELYDQCASIFLDLDQASLVSDECDCKILFLQQGVEDDINNGASLFDAVDDSVFKKAMSLYTKQKECDTAVGTPVEDQEKKNTEVDHPVENQEKENCEVKVNNDDDSKEVDKPSGSGSLMVLTNLSTSELIEFGSVNFSRIHSPESTH